MRNLVIIIFIQSLINIINTWEMLPNLKHVDAVSSLVQSFCWMDLMKYDLKYNIFLLAIKNKTALVFKNEYCATKRPPDDRLHPALAEWKPICCCTEWEASDWFWMNILQKSPQLHAVGCSAMKEVANKSLPLKWRLNWLELALKAGKLIRQDTFKLEPDVTHRLVTEHPALTSIRTRGATKR